MFLKSHAHQQLDEECQRDWDWSATSILLVSHDWDPEREGAEAIAGRRLAKALLAAGSRVHVLSASGTDYPLVSTNYNNTVARGPEFASNKFLRAWQMVRSTIPEAEGRWVAPAVKAGTRVLAKLPQHTVIYSRASPGTSNIVAWYLARQTRLPWIAHFSDQWPSVQVLGRGRRLLAPYKWPLFRMWRGRIVRDSGALTFTNPREGEYFVGTGFQPYLAKAFVVPHLASDGECGNADPPRDLFHIVHTGNFYPPGHTSAGVIQGIRLFLDREPAARGRTTFTQAGWSNGDVQIWTERCGLKDVVRLTGRLTQSEVVALLRQASLLVAVDYARPRSRTILSKLPDYVRARRPILAVTGPDSALRELFERDGVGLTADYKAPSEVAARIASVWRAWMAGQFRRFLPGPSAIRSFSRDHALSELAGAILVAQRARAVEVEVGQHRLHQQRADS